MRGATAASAAIPPAGVDLVVTAVAPASAAAGDRVVPSATVKNQGDAATPGGTNVDVAFAVEGATVWSDSSTIAATWNAYLNAIEAGVQTANGSPRQLPANIRATVYIARWPRCVTTRVRPPRSVDCRARG